MTLINPNNIDYNLISNIADYLISEGNANFSVAPINYNVRYDTSVPIETYDAYNAIKTITNAHTSEALAGTIKNSGLQQIHVNISNIPGVQPSSAFPTFNFVNINTSQVGNTYKVLGSGEIANFNLQHIVNHELAHVLTGLPDGPEHNSLVNTINSQTSGGLPRESYENAYGFFLTENPNQSTSGNRYVSEVTGEELHPHLVSRYNHETGTFGQAVVWNTTNSSPSEISSALSQVKSSDGSVGQVSDYLPNGAQITGSGAPVQLASGTVVNAGTVVNPGNGYTYVVNSDGSTTNLDTGNTYGGSTPTYNPSTNTWDSSDVGSASTQITGSGPIVTLASGATVNAGTTVDASNGYDYRVNDDGSTTSSSGHTYGNGTQRYNPDTNSWDTVGPPQSSDDGDSGGSSSGKPVLLDLDGNGIEITTLSSSNFFFDMSGDGKLNRTAWAGAGDGVLVRDAGDDGVIEQRNEVDFTSWAPGAKIRGTLLGGKVGVKLMRVVSDWARAQGAEELHIYSTAGIDPAHSDRFFRKLGFQPYGGNYVARLG